MSICQLGVARTTLFTLCLIASSANRAITQELVVNATRISGWRPQRRPAPFGMSWPATPDARRHGARARLRARRTVRQRHGRLGV